MLPSELTDEELNAIEARLKFWEDEYWRRDDADPFVVVATNRKGKAMPPIIQNNRFARDEIATFVESAPEDIHKLLNEVRRLRTELAKTQAS